MDSEYLKKDSGYLEMDSGYFEMYSGYIELPSGYFEKLRWTLGTRWYHFIHLEIEWIIDA